MPTFNVEKYIIRTLESVAKQSYKNFELIIIDDGSTDNTVNLVGNFLKNYNICYKIFIENHKGVSQARNLGLLKSTGDYIYILDSDDIIEENLIESLLNKIIYDHADAAFCAADSIAEDKHIINVQNLGLTQDVYSNENLIRKFMLKDLKICTGNVLYDATVIKGNKLCYTDNCNNGEDQEFNLKVLSNCNKISFINKILFHYLVRDNSSTKVYNIHKLDSYFAMLRVSEYYKSNDRKSLYNIIIRHKLQKEFFNNLDTLIHNNYKNNKNDVNVFIFGTKNLKRNLLKYRIYKMEIVEIKLLFKVVLFCISPELYLKRQIKIL